MTLLKTIIRDVFYISKITNVTKKKITLLFVVIMSQITAFSDVAIIVLFASVFTGDAGDGIIGEAVKLLLEYQFIIPLVVVVRFYITYMQSMTLKKMEMNVTKNLKVHLMEEVFEKRNYSVADAYFYLNTLSGHVAFFYSSLVSFINSLLQSIAYVAFLTVADSEVFLVLLVGVVTLLYPLKYLIKQSKKYMHKIYTVTQNAGEEIQRIVDNMFLIKLLNKEKEELDNFNNTLSELNENDYKNLKYITLNGFLPNFITLFTFSVLIGIPRFVGSITLDFVGVTLRLFQSLGILSTGFSKILNSHVHISELYKILKNREILDKNNYIVTEDKNKLAIKFENVKFKYFNSEEYIFNGIDLVIKKGTHNIITGPNGSGKSTLLGLLSGVYYANKGKVYTYSDRFGYIGATPLIFTKTLRENLLYGNDKKVSDEILINELKSFDTFKEDSSYNLDRVISNKSLSSGQMQKIAFIRALLSDMEILVLDESTANLDETSRNLVFKILKKRNITIVNSTHDPDMFEFVDQHLQISLNDENRVITSTSLG